MKKFYLLLLVCLITSCSATQNSIWYSDKNIKDVNIGMTKKKVISIMGESYEIIGAKKGNVTLGYKTLDNGIYKLIFVDDKLVEWNKEWLKYYYQDKPDKQ